MIKFEEVSFGYPQKDLYDKISFSIEDGEHVVLIGSNGAGKSSLLKLITDTDRYTYEGLIRKDKNARIAYVPQFVRHDSGEISVFEYLNKPFEELLAKSDEVCARMASADEKVSAKAFEEYQKVQDEIDSTDAYNSGVNISRQLFVAGLSSLENNSLDSISGGEFKLISIIRSMLLKPQLLVMDEPDVFLDFENIAGLIKLINGYGGSLLVVTHNRLLLGFCFDKVLHAENLELQEFPGSFAEYNLAMLETKIALKEQYMKFDDFIEGQIEMIEKMRKSASYTSDPKKGRQLKARVSYMERLVKKRGENPFLEGREYSFALKDDGRGEPGEEILSVENYSLEFDHPVLTDVNFKINRGDKIVIVGANGTGKTSLLKYIEEKLAEKEDLGVFRQIFDCEGSEQLSGGEQNIKVLNALSEETHSVYILDEPTSHLDIYAQESFEKAIAESKATVITVTHDFYLAGVCADRVFVLENGTLRESSGRAYRKSVYKKYFSSDIFEQERLRKEREMTVNALLAKGKYEEAKQVLAETVL